MIALAQGMNQHFGQGQHRSDGLNISARDRFEEWTHQRSVLGMLFDEVDERRGIEADDRSLQGLQPFHEERSRWMYSCASMDCQTSAPRPSNSSTLAGSEADASARAVSSQIRRN